MACEGGHSSTAALLVSHGATREARDNSGRTPLHVAAVHRHTELVRVLLEAECHVDAVDNVSAMIRPRHATLVTIILIALRLVKLCPSLLFIYNFFKLKMFFFK